MVTIRDVAQKSGVSVATVSYVLNDGPRTVRPETRERVQVAINELNFRPNVTARHLARRRTHTLGVLIGNGALVTEGNPYTATVVSGILTSAGESGYNVTLITENWREKGVKHLLANLNIEGMLVVAPLLGDSIVADIQEQQVPMVVLSSMVHASSGVMCIDVDNACGMQMATEHLIGLGHQRIAFLSGDLQQPCTELRRQGFHRAMQSAGLDIRKEFDVVSSFDGDRCRDDVQRLLSSGSDSPTAILCGNDRIAIVALEEARSNDIPVPEALSIVGFDDGVGASLVSPPLTTVRQPLAQMAGEAVQILINEIKQTKNVTKNIVERLGGNKTFPISPKIVRPELIIRSSTGSCK
jgi:DNA-binding LacI/PurR family transcriptional regulator